MIDRSTKTNFVLGLVILWAFSAIVFKEARDFLFWIPLAGLAWIVLEAWVNYSFFKEFRRFLQPRGGAVLSHNATYTKFDISSDGKRMEIAVTPGGRWSPGSISFAVAFEKEEHRTFSLSPSMRNTDPEGNMILAEGFRVNYSAIPPASIENLLLPVGKDLLECLDAEPVIDVDGQALVVEFRLGTYNRNVNRNWLERYLRITHGLVDSLSKEEDARIDHGKGG